MEVSAGFQWDHVGACLSYPDRQGRWRREQGTER